MTCHQLEDVLLDRARGEQHLTEDAALDAHLGDCARCRARLAREAQLTAGLKALSGRTAGMRSADRLEDTLVAAFQQAHRRPPGAGWRQWAAIAAMLLIAVAGATLAWQSAAGRAGPGFVAPGPAPVGQPPESEFVSWPGAAALPPFESGQLVRTELPASVLPLLGIRPARLTTGQSSVMADVLVGQDGLARAVRLAN